MDISEEMKKLAEAEGAKREQERLRQVALAAEDKRKIEKEQEQKQKQLMVSAFHDLVNYGEQAVKAFRLHQANGANFHQKDDNINNQFIITSTMGLVSAQPMQDYSIRLKFDFGMPPKARTIDDLYFVFVFEKPLDDGEPYVWLSKTTGKRISSDDLAVRMVKVAVSGENAFAEFQQ